MEQKKLVGVSTYTSVNETPSKIKTYSLYEDTYLYKNSLFKLFLKKIFKVSKNATVSVQYIDKQKELNTTYIKNKYKDILAIGIGEQLNSYPFLFINIIEYKQYRPHEGDETLTTTEREAAGGTSFISDMDALHKAFGEYLERSCGIFKEKKKEKIGWNATFKVKIHILLKNHL